jgi:hypothetical protein
MRFHPQVRGLMAFIRSQYGFHGCSILLLSWMSRSQSGVRWSVSVHGLPRSVQTHASADCLNPWALPSGCVVTTEPGLVSPGVFVRVTPEPGRFAAGQTHYWVIHQPELRRPAYLSALERR